MASLWNTMLIAGAFNVVNGYHVVETKMTWTAASAYCSDNFGTTLATFTTDAEASELRALMDASSQNTFWFGLNDLASEGTWVFESGYDCGGNCDSMKEWDSGEPNDNGNNEDCALFWPSGTTFKMNDGWCSSVLAFICDEAATTTDPTTDPTVEPTEFHCSTHGCDDLTVCDAVSGECKRDCDVLHIDEFLTDCSVEWESQETTIATLTADIATNTASINGKDADIATNAAGIATNTESINGNDADIAANAADIATNTQSINGNDADIATNAANIATATATGNDNAADITSLETRMDSVESKLVDIQLVLDKLEVFGAHSSFGNVDALKAADLVEDGSLTAISLSGKDLVIVSMLAVNAVLITSMAIVCCRKQHKFAKYQAVSIASD